MPTPRSPDFSSFTWRDITLPVLLALTLAAGAYSVSQFTGLSSRVTAIESNRYTIGNAKKDLLDVERRMQRLELQMTRAQAKLDQLPPQMIKDNQSELRELRRRMQKVEVQVQTLFGPYQDERSHP